MNKIPIRLALGLAVASCALGLVPGFSASAAAQQSADWHGPGRVIASPWGGEAPGTADVVSPDRMSIVFTSEKVAWDFYHEAVQNGERVCIADLGRAPKGHKRGRWWLFTC